VSIEREGFSTSVLIPLIAIIGALIVNSILLLAVGVNPLFAYKSLLSGALGSTYGITESLVKATPLLLVSLSMTVAFKCNVWNIGAEGQMIIATIVVTWVTLAIGDRGGPLLLLLAMLVGFLGGAFWAFIPGLLKAKFEVNEVIVTLMMNYIATFLLSYLVHGPMMDPKAYGYPLSPVLPKSALLPKLVKGSRSHAGVLIALLCALLTYILLWKTPLGYYIRAVGLNPEAAYCAGINVFRSIIIAMILSGGLAGLAGMIEVCGVHRRLLDTPLSGGYGYLGIPVALVGRLHPLGVVLASLFFGTLFVGAEMMQRTTGIPTTLVYCIEGLMMLFLVSSEFITKRGRA